MKKAIILMGLPGVGKTTTAIELYRRNKNVQLLEADNLWKINPFQVNDENKRMVESNILSVYNNFCMNPLLQTLIFTWVIPNQDLFDKIREWFDKTENTYFLLTCDSNEYKKRLESDKRDLSILEREHLLRENYSKMDVIKIDTTGLNINHIIKKIEYISQI